MCRVIQLTVTISLLTASPLFAQEMPTLEWRAVHFTDAGLTYSGSTTLTGDPTPQSPDKGWPLWANVVGGAVLGAATLAGVTTVTLGLIYLQCEVRCDGFFNQNIRDTDVTFGGVIAIAAGVGFVAGGILGAFIPRETGGRRRRANMSIARLHDGSIGLGASVRF